MPSSACRRGGGEANAEARRASWLWGSGAGYVSVAPTVDGRQQWPRPRPREAHAAAHLRIVPVDAPSTLDQPPELRLIAVLCGLPHGLVHRVAHCARRALQAFARSDSCAFGGGTRGSAAGQFEYPTALALVDSKLFVLDCDSARVQVFE